MNIENSCQHIEEMLSGYLDGELTQQEGQHVNIHMGQCATCAHFFAQLRQLQGSIQQTRYPELETEKLRKLLYDSTSRTLQGVSWFAIVAGVVTILVMAAYEFWMNSVMPWYERLAIGLLWGGGLGLFVSVLRQRLIARKTDKYRKVKL